MHDQIEEGREMIKRDLVFNDTWLKDVYHVKVERGKRGTPRISIAHEIRGNYSFYPAKQKYSH